MDDKAETLEAVLKEAVDLVLKQSISSLCFMFSFPIFTGFALIICFFWCLCYLNSIPGMVSFLGL